MPRRPDRRNRQGRDIRDHAAMATAEAGRKAGGEEIAQRAEETGTGIESVRDIVGHGSDVG